MILSGLIDIFVYPMTNASYEETSKEAKKPLVPLIYLNSGSS